MLRYLFIFICCLAACKTTQQSKATAQGTWGQITELIGNQMPSPDLPASSNKGQAIQATIHFYPPIAVSELELNAKGLYKPINRIQPVAVCTSDKLGGYRQALPAGTYSIVVVLQDGWFAHQSDGNTVQPVQVKKGGWVEKNIQLNYRAVH